MNELILSAVIGVVVGAAFKYIIQIIIYLFKRISKTHICGNWVSYLCITVNGTVKWVKAEVEIKRGFLCEYSAKAVYCGNPYTGEGVIENDNLCFKYTRIGHMQKITSNHRIKSLWVNSPPLCGEFRISVCFSNFLNIKKGTKGNKICQNSLTFPQPCGTIASIAWA